MAELKGIDYLRKKLDQKRVRVLLRYKFYEMKNYTADLNISTPDFLKHWTPVLGWCAKAVDSLADRLMFKEFKNDTFDLNTIYNMNNPDTLFSSAILGALIGSCDFIYIVPNGKDIPSMQVIDGSEATGIIDPVTGLLTEGYAVLERDDHGQILTEAYFRPYLTQIVYRQGRGDVIYDYPHVSSHPLLVPIVYRPDSKRPFGHSRISRACMDIQGAAIRTIKRSEISAEFYSFPQKYVSGLSEEAEPLDKWKATMSSMLMFTKDQDGDRPTIGQFSQQSMQPHADQLKMFASLFGGETGLTLDDLGFVSDNPSSAESIKAAHENLRLTAAKAQKTFGTGFLNAGYLARCIMDDYDYRRTILYETTPVWYPAFALDFSAMSLVGDGVVKINQAIPNYFNKASLEELTGIKAADGMAVQETIVTNGEEEIFTEVINE